MRELQHILNTHQFQSKATLMEQLGNLGIKAGDHIMVHASMKAMGWVAGGPQAIVEALIESVTSEGTVVMPAQSADNSEPSYWMMPPVPEEWHDPIRKEWPAFDPHLTPLRGMGKIAECFHRHPETIRSMHPAHSFMAWGRHAREWMKDHPLEDSFGKGSPLGKMLKTNVKIMLIGVDYDVCTALHYAESVQETKTASPQGAAILADGVRRWETYECMDMDSDLFPDIVKSFTGDIQKGKLGQADTKITLMRPLVEFAADWLKIHNVHKK
jgi:aminoglycoside 3-N-acetyltransferase